jgi:hypothetical protein
MSKQNNESQTTRFLLRMSNSHYDYIKAESQRMSVSMTSFINIIVDNFINRQKLKNDGTGNED